MKNDKILLIIITIIIIAIIVIIGVIYFINKNKSIQKKEEDDEIFNAEEGGAEYSLSALNNFDFVITNLNTNIGINEKEFTLKVKEYVYLNGLVQANQAECIHLTEKEDVMIFTLQLNDPKQTVLTVSMNVKDNTYRISE